MRACMHATDWPVCTRGRPTTTQRRAASWALTRHTQRSKGRGQAVCSGVTWWHGAPVSRSPVLRSPLPRQRFWGTMYSWRQFLLSDGCLIRHIPALSIGTVLFSPNKTVSADYQPQKPSAEQLSNIGWCFFQRRQRQHESKLKPAPTVPCQETKS